MPALPHGSTAIAAWAASRRYGYDPLPDEAWFRRWEPHDTIAPPARFFNAVTWMARPDPGHVVVVEPWYAEEGDPLERVLLAFAVHPALRHRAAARAGDHFVTRAAYIESPPPPEVKLGDPIWDANVASFALSAEEAAAGFHRRVRKLLSGWGFRGHVELRPGGLVVYYAGLAPTPDGYDRLMRVAREIVGKAVAFETR